MNEWMNGKQVSGPVAMQKDTTLKICYNVWCNIYSINVLMLKY